MEKKKRKLSLKRMIFSIAVLLTFFGVYKAYAFDMGNYVYDINGINIDGSYVTIYGWGYGDESTRINYNSKAKGSSVADLKNKVAGSYTHGYYLECNGKQYVDVGGSQAGVNYDTLNHTDLNYKIGTTKYNYKGIGFVFKIPLSDFNNITTTKNVDFKLHIYQDGRDISFYITYVGSGGTYNYGNLQIVKHAASASTYVSPTGDATYVRTGPGKNYAIATATIGGKKRNLYYTKGSTFSQGNGTLDGGTYLDSNATRWYKVRYKPTGKAVSNRYKVTPNSSGSWGYINTSFCTGGTTKFVLKITAKHTLDVNGRLDGSNVGNTAGYGTFDVYVGGSLVANDVTDYYNSSILYGTSYSISDIRATSGHVYNGVYSGSANSTIGGSNASTYLSFSKATYSNHIAHWMGGFRTGDGNNGTKTMWNATNTYWNQTYGQTYTMNSSRAMSIPKGFTLNSTFGTQSISGSWGSYAMGTTVTQKATSMNYEYYYYPTTYNITYNMNGGTNHASNPSSYTILYGVTLQNPTRPGWKFNGWEMNGQKVTGINPGATAKFSSEADMRNKLNSRTIGNVTLTATWLPIPVITGPVIDNVDNNPIAPFLDGNNLIIQQGDMFTPLKYVTATDPVEGEAITAKVKVKSMTLPLDNGRANTTGTFTVTYTVTNNSGVTAEKTINVLVNEPPKITGPNVRHKLVHEKIDDTFLLSQQNANDKEDSNITPKLGVKMIKDEMGNVIDKAEDIDTRYVADYEITITVTDKYKKTVDKTYTLKIVKDDFKYTESHDTEFRFISKAAKETLSKDSSFVINNDLAELLASSLDKTDKSSAQKVVKFSTEEIQNVRNRIKN